MDKILGQIGGMPNLASRNDDDFSDRLNHRFTTSLLVAFAMIVTSKQYVGDPINCWVPAHFKDNHVTYTNGYCWVRNTYYLAYDEHIPREHESDKRHMIPYYQWMPIILLLQALLFYMPILFWRTLNKRSGVDVNYIVEAGESFLDCSMTEDQDKIITIMSDHLDRYLKLMSEKKKTSVVRNTLNCLCRCVFVLTGRHQGNYLIWLYLVTKVLFIINVIGQLFALNSFLATDFHMYGINVLREMLQGNNPATSPRFPRITMCDLKVRRLGNVQRYTVQCVLPINLYNEKIYLFLWFWMVLVATMACMSLLTWSLHLFNSTDRRRYVEKHVTMMQGNDTRRKNRTIVNTEGVDINIKINDDNGKHFKFFVDDYLRQDGFFVLRLVGHNTNAITVTEFVWDLWRRFRQQDLKTNK